MKRTKAHPRSRIRACPPISMAWFSLAVVACPHARATDLPAVKTCEPVDVVAMTVNETGSRIDWEERAPSIEFDPPVFASDKGLSRRFGTIVIKAPINSGYEPEHVPNNPLVVESPTITVSCTNSGIVVSGRLSQEQAHIHPLTHANEYEIEIQVVLCRPRLTVRAEWRLHDRLRLWPGEAIDKDPLDKEPGLISIDKVVSAEPLPAGHH